MLKLTLFTGLAAVLFTSCNLSDAGRASNRDPQPEKTAPTANADSPSSPDGNVRAGGSSAPVPTTKSECLNVDTGDKMLLKSQTFAIDFEPFRSACFVTAHNPEYEDPAVEAEMSIYKDGKKVFVFPEQFNGVTFGCWVEAVAFQDLNADGRTDIIVVGKCSAKTEPYNENVVYVNTGKAFVTDTNANYKITDLKKAKEIADFVKANQKSFFK